MQQPSTPAFFTVNINGQRIKCDLQLCKMSTFLHNLLFLGSNTFDIGLQLDPDHQQTQQQQIHIELIDYQTFTSFMHFCQINDYKQPAILRPVTSNKLEMFLDEKNFLFIEKFKFMSPELLALKNAAQFLGCKALEMLIAVKFACLLYFEDNEQSYKEKCDELGVVPDIKVEDVQSFNQEFCFINP